MVSAWQTQSDMNWFICWMPATEASGQLVTVVVPQSVPPWDGHPVSLMTFLVVSCLKKAPLLLVQKL